MDSKCGQAFILKYSSAVLSDSSVDRPLYSSTLVLFYLIQV